VVAKFVPGAGAVLSVYRAVTWVLENQAQLGNLAQQFLNILDTLTNPLLTRDDGITAVTTAVRTGLDNAVSGLLGMAASQFGLGNLPTEFKRAIQYVPVQVDTIIRAAVARVAVRLGGGASRGLFAGQMAPERTFSHNGIVYVLWVAQDSTGPQVKVARVKAGGGFDYIGTLTAASFTNALREGLDGKNAQEHIDALILAAKALHTATKTAGTSTGALQQKRDAMATSAIPAPGTVSATSSAADKLIADVKNDACKALQAGCFAAGTKLYTRRGWVAVEALVEGDEVAARHESEPGGAVEWKPVEATFRRTGRILHLHFANGELIRTTPEHPFHVEGKGWTAAGALREGDRLVTLIGDSVPLAEVFDTEQWETVYNVRVADFHTYFVGEEGWGWAAWAHNEYRTLFIKAEDANRKPNRVLFNPFQVQAGTNAASAPADIASQVTEAKAITLLIINTLRAAMPGGPSVNDTTGVAFVLRNGHVELWVSQNGNENESVTAERRRALYQVLTKDSEVNGYLNRNSITVELKPSTPMCAQTAKQVINRKTATNLSAAEQTEYSANVAAMKAASEHANKPDDQIPLKDLNTWRNDALKQLNHAERHVYRQLEQESATRLLAIGSTIAMCPVCEGVTVAKGLQYAIAVPTSSGNYVTTPAGWQDRRD
jgi:hypothetical protein